MLVGHRECSGSTKIPAQVWSCQLSCTTSIDVNRNQYTCTHTHLVCKHWCIWTYIQVLYHQQTTYTSLSDIIIPWFFSKYLRKTGLGTRLLPKCRNGKWAQVWGYTFQPLSYLYTHIWCMSYEKLVETKVWFHQSLLKIVPVIAILAQFCWNNFTAVQAFSL